MLRFLGLDESFPIAATEANPTVRVRSRRMHELVHAVSVGHGPVSARGQGVGEGRHARRRSAQRPVRGQAARSSSVEPEPADEQLMIELRRRFKPEVEALSEYVGRDLVALWGYDRLD